MALTWDITGIKDYEQVCRVEHDGKSYLNPVTEGLIFSTMYIELGSITEKNWKEFYRRIHVWERAVGPILLSSTDKIPYMTPQNIRDHIGLRCNVIDRPVTTFKTKIYNMLIDRANHTLERSEILNELDRVDA